eukprot:g3027.t1
MSLEKKILEAEDDFSPFPSEEAEHVFKIGTTSPLRSTRISSEVFDALERSSDQSRMCISDLTSRSEKMARKDYVKKSKRYKYNEWKETKSTVLHHRADQNRCVNKRNPNRMRRAFCRNDLSLSNSLQGSRSTVRSANAYLNKDNRRDKNIDNALSERLYSLQERVAEHFKNRTLTEIRYGRDTYHNQVETYLRSDNRTVRRMNVSGQCNICREKATEIGHKAERSARCIVDSTTGITQFTGAVKSLIESRRVERKMFEKKHVTLANSQGYFPNVRKVLGDILEKNRKIEKKFRKQCNRRTFVEKNRKSAEIPNTSESSSTDNEENVTSHSPVEVEIIDIDDLYTLMKESGRRRIRTLNNSGELSEEDFESQNKVET